MCPDTSCVQRWLRSHEVISEALGGSFSDTSAYETQAYNAPALQGRYILAWEGNSAPEGRPSRRGVPGGCLHASRRSIYVQRRLRSRRIISEALRRPFSDISAYKTLTCNASAPQRRCHAPRERKWMPQRLLFQNSRLSAFSGSSSTSKPGRFHTT